METMLKYAIFFIVLVSAISSTANGVQYTAISGDPQIDPLCADAAIAETDTATIPQDLWSGTAAGCVYVTITNALGSESVQVLVVGGASDDNSFLLSGDAFNEIDDDQNDSQIDIVYLPPV